MDTLRPRPTTGDLVLVGMLAGVGAWEVPRRVAEGGTPWWLVLTTALCVLPLVGRQAFPLAVLVTVAATFAAYPVLDGPEVLTQALALLLALYSVAAHAGAGPALAGLVVGVATGLIRSVMVDGVDTVSTVVNAAWAVPPWVVGRLVRYREERASLAEWQAEAAVARAALAQEQAAEDERRRIARELHDVVAHAVTVMVVQARGGRHSIDRNPAAAREAFEAVERLGQEALGELRRLLAMLPDEERVPDPLPGLAAADALVEQVRAAGLDVEFHREGTGPDLPAAADFSAYRVLQEALTNALRYAGPGRTVARLVHHDTGVDIAVVNPVAGEPVSVGSGTGLVGAGERVAAFGGTLHAGRRGGSFELHASVPREAGS